MRGILEISHTIYGQERGRESYKERLRAERKMKRMGEGKRAREGWRKEELGEREKKIL